jgi:HSP20 family protein
MFAMVTRPGWGNSDVRRLNRLMDEMLGRWPWGDAVTTEGEPTATWVPAVDIFESKDELRLVAELPGVKPEDVRLSVEHATLTLRGEKKQVAEGTTDTVHRYERSYGVFQRSFQLPGTVDADRIQARYEHGVLTVTLPKAEKARAREIAVQVI